jgi:hypothetical protein
MIGLYVMLVWVSGGDEGDGLCIGIKIRNQRSRGSEGCTYRVKRKGEGLFVYKCI